MYLTTSTTGFRNCIAVQLLLYGWNTAYFISVWFFFQKIFLWNCRRKKSGKIFVTTHVMSSNMSKINWNWWHEIELFRVFQSLVPKYCLLWICAKKVVKVQNGFSKRKLFTWCFDEFFGSITKGHYMIVKLKSKQFLETRHAKVLSFGLWTSFSRRRINKINQFFCFCGWTKIWLNFQNPSNSS